MRIEATGPALKKLEAFSTRHGMTNVALMSKLVEWFSTQKDSTQRAMLPFHGETAADVSEPILKQMISGK